jgi:S-adenosylmethionine/arginine decarboxylase-like enzyme
VFDMLVAKIPNSEAVELWIDRDLPKIGITALKTSRHDFESPVKGEPAYTVVAVLSASHMAVHASPEHEWVQVVFATCDGMDRREELTTATNVFFRPRASKLSRFRCGVEGLEP